jgi:phage-related protein
MAIGFFLLNGTTNVCPDRGLNRTSTPRIHTAKFGDGYEQRIRNGINALEETFSIAFINRPPEEIDDIIALFETRGGVVPFNLTVPNTNKAGGEETIKVVCDNWSKVYTYTIASGCTANFRRVYEP